MNRTEFIDIMNSKSFDELLEGYKRSISLIKQIDKEGYKEIINCFRYLKENCPQKLVEFNNLIKQYWEDKSNKRLLNEIYFFHFIPDNPTEAAKHLNLLPTQKLYNMSIQTLVIENGSVEAFDIVCIKRKKNINEVESKNVYVITPVFNETLQLLNENMNQGFNIYTKHIHADVSSSLNFKTMDYTLYKSSDGKLKTNVRISDPRHDDKTKTKNIKSNRK